jgi:hypothetical protein
MNIDTEQKRQVDVLSKYLLGTSVKHAWVYDVYAQVCKQQVSNEAIVDFAFRYPSLLPFLDAGLVFIRPNSELRRRIHIVFAALESTPEHAQKFMPEKVSFLQFLSLIGVGIRAVFRAIVGIVIIKVVQL